MLTSSEVDITERIRKFNISFVDSIFLDDCYFWYHTVVIYDEWLNIHSGLRVAD